METVIFGLAGLTSYYPFYLLNKNKESKKKITAPPSYNIYPYQFSSGGQKIVIRDETPVPVTPETTCPSNASTTVNGNMIPSATGCYCNQGYALNNGVCDKDTVYDLYVALQNIDTTLGSSTATITTLPNTNITNSTNLLALKSANTILAANTTSTYKNNCTTLLNTVRGKILNEITTVGSLLLDMINTYSLDANTTTSFNYTSFYSSYNVLVSKLNYYQNIDSLIITDSGSSTVFITMTSNFNTLSTALEAFITKQILEKLIPLYTQLKTVTNVLNGSNNTILNDITTRITGLENIVANTNTKPSIKTKYNKSSAVSSYTALSLLIDVSTSINTSVSPPTTTLSAKDLHIFVSQLNRFNTAYNEYISFKSNTTYPEGNLIFYNTSKFPINVLYFDGTTTEACRCNHPSCAICATSPSDPICSTTKCPTTTKCLSSSTEQCRLSGSYWKNTYYADMLDFSNFINGTGSYATSTFTGLIKTSDNNTKLTELNEFLNNSSSITMSYQSALTGSIPNSNTVSLPGLLRFFAEMPPFTSSIDPILVALNKEFTYLNSLAIQNTINDSDPKAPNTQINFNIMKTRQERVNQIILSKNFISINPQTFTIKKENFSGNNKSNIHSKKYDTGLFRGEDIFTYDNPYEQREYLINYYNYTSYDPSGYIFSDYDDSAYEEKHITYKHCIDPILKLNSNYMLKENLEICDSALGITCDNITNTCNQINNNLTDVTSTASYLTGLYSSADYTDLLSDINRLRPIYLKMIKGIPLDITNIATIDTIKTKVVTFKSSWSSNILNMYYLRLYLLDFFNKYKYITTAKKIRLQRITPGTLNLLEIRVYKANSDIPLPSSSFNNVISSNIVSGTLNSVFTNNNITPLIINSSDNNTYFQFEIDTNISDNSSIVKIEIKNGSSVSPYNNLIGTDIFIINDINKIITEEPITYASQLYSFTLYDKLVSFNLSIESYLSAYACPMGTSSTFTDNLPNRSDCRCPIDRPQWTYDYSAGYERCL